MEILVFILPLFVILVIVIAVYNHKKEKQRQQKLREFAHSRNLYFHEARVHGFEQEYPDFSFLRQGGGRYAYNIISGESNGNEVTGFDYHFQTTSTDSKGRTTTHHHHFSGFIIKSPFNLKPLTIRPEGLFDKMVGAFGWDDIDFESAEFSRKFHVKAEDRRWAYDVLPQITMEYLLESPPYELHMDHRNLVVRGKSRFEPWEFRKALEIGETVLNGIPEFARS